MMAASMATIFIVALWTAGTTGYGCAMSLAWRGNIIGIGNGVSGISFACERVANVTISHVTIVLDPVPQGPTIVPTLLRYSPVSLGVAGGLIEVVVPYWIVMGCGLLTCGVSWRVSRRRRVAGCCRACGYSLRGLSATGSCPECGNVVLKGSGISEKHGADS